MYLDANGIDHASYNDACVYYGADTPADLAAEDRYWREQERETYHGEAMVDDARKAGHIAPFDPVADWNPWGYDVAA
jgi:hypothetical protein